MFEERETDLSAALDGGSFIQRILLVFVAGTAITIERWFELNRVRIKAHRILTGLITMVTGFPTYSWGL